MSNKFQDQKIQEISSLEIQSLPESEFSYCNGWSRAYRQTAWSAAVTKELDRVASYDPRPCPSPPESLPAFQAVEWEVGALGVDIRPHVYDPVLQQWLLCDSGSQISAFPPDPGDKEDNTMFLKAVNGTKIKCFGQKDVYIKIGRKNYPFKVIKAEVKNPVIGWDFFKFHKLDFRWNEFGDITLWDPKAKISAVLTYKSVPFNDSQEHKRLYKVDSSSNPAVTPSLGSAPPPQLRSAKDSRRLVAEVASIKSLDAGDYGGKKDLDRPENAEFKALLDKFPELLHQAFTDEYPKNGVIHRIHTGSSSPCRARTRRMIPGSPKEVMAKKCWFELVDMGVVERVNPSESNTWLSPVHFVPKGDGTLRPTGDFRSLNQKTELDLFPLPHLLDFTQNIAGSSIFSKVDDFTPDIRKSASLLTQATT